MSRIKLSLRSLSVPEKVAKAKQIISALTGNSDFPTPQPALAQVSAAADHLQSALADIHAAKQTVTTKISIMREKEEALESLLRQLTAYIESVGGNDESKILSTGVSLRSTTLTPTPATAPTGLSASLGEHEGEINLSWGKVKNAKSYVIERTADPPSAGSWSHEMVSTKASVTIKGLESDKRYWFRVAAVLSSGQSGWSNPSAKKAA